MSDPHAFPAPFRVAAVQMVSTPERERNLQEAARLVAEAADNGAQLVLLPEYFCFMGFRGADKLAGREPYRGLCRGGTVAGDFGALGVCVPRGREPYHGKRLAVSAACDFVKRARAPSVKAREHEVIASDQGVLTMNRPSYR